MLCPVICSCGKSLDAYYDAFVIIRQEKMKEILKNHPDNVIPWMISASDELQPEMGETLDKMHMTRECCREKLLTIIKYSEFY